MLLRRRRCSREAEAGAAMAVRRSLRKEQESPQKRRRSLRLQGKKNLSISYQRSLAYQGSTSSKITECTTPRTLFKKVLQTLPIASPLVPINPDTSEPGEPAIRLPPEQILTSDLETSLSESASQVKCRVSLLKTKSKKICLSEFERDLNKQFDSNAAQSSLENTSLTKSLQISFRTPAPLPIDGKKGLIRRPKNYRGINVKDFEGGIEQNLLHGQESQSYLLAVQTATLLTSDVEMNAADTELFAHPLPFGQNKEDFSDAPSQHTTARQSLARRSARPSSQTFWPTDEKSGTDFGVSECGQREVLGSRTEFADESRSMPEEKADGPAEEQQKKTQDAVEELVGTGDTGEVEAIPQERLLNSENAEQETLHRDTYVAQLLSLPEEYLTTETGPLGSSTPVHANLTEASSGHLSPLLKEISAKNSVKEMVTQIIEELDRSVIPAVVGQGISGANLEEPNERAIHVLQNYRATTPGRCVSRKDLESLERPPRKETTEKINQQVDGGKTLDGLATEGEQSEISEAEMDPESEEMSEAETDLENVDPTEKTPAFVRARAFQCTSLLSTPQTQKMAVSRSSIPQLSIKKAPKRTTRVRSKKREPALPSSMVKKLFSHYVRMPVAKDAFEAVERCVNLYFKHLSDDLEAYTSHARRKTTEPADLELLMRRQGLITDKMPLNVLIERHLPLEYRKLLIPVATTGNKVVPSKPL